MSARAGREPRHVVSPSADDLAAALRVVRAALPPTPLLDGAPALLKVEAAQPTGSFKVRGALAAFARTGAGLVTASTGNHALAIAWAATRLGRRATVVVPATASEAKLDGLRRYDAEVVRRGETFDDAERHARQLARDGVPYVSAYNDTHVIAGQATIGPELEALDGPLTIVCPLGGGGLLGGLCLWARSRPDVTLVGVEAARSRAMTAAVQAGHTVAVDIGPTLADGLAGNLEPGSVTVDIVRERVDEIVAVSDDDITEAIRHLVREHGLVAEGAGATALAALLAGHVRPRSRPLALVTGRNITRERLAALLA